MLYHLFLPLESVFSGFRVFRYATFRAAFAALLAFLIATIVGPGIVRALARHKVAGTVLTGNEAEDARRLARAKIPTMGGVILLAGVGLSSLLLARLDTHVTWIAILSFLAFGALGAGDDWKKLTVPGSTGMSERAKLLGQGAIAVVVLSLLYGVGSHRDGKPWLRLGGMKESPYVEQTERWRVVQPGETLASVAAATMGDASGTRDLAVENGLEAADGSLLEPVPGSRLRIPRTWTDPSDHHHADLQVPFWKRFCLDLGLFLIPFGLLVIVGTSNAVNLTDGLDGLAIGITATVAATLGVAAYVAGQADLARELYVFHVPHAEELAVVCAALVGGALGFLWFNGHPATVFMGDTGSLSIGGILGVVAVAIRHELTLLIAGGVFVVEALSVLWQRTWFKGTRAAARRRGEPNPTGKRWFRIAPLHHHFQQGGLHENKVVVRFWIVSVVCAVVALATLKVR
jgi:phospho-N-acetylmuramoyl-pentapeptide-transferase